MRADGLLISSEDNTILDNTSSLLESSYGELRKVFDYLNSNNPYTEIQTLYFQRKGFDNAYYYDILEIVDDEKRNEKIRALSKTQLVNMFVSLNQFLNFASKEKIESIIELRYRRYLFRILYILWQDNYDNALFKNLFLFTLEQPKTMAYVSEINFSIEKIRELVTASNTESKMIEFSRLEKQDMRNFLDFHRIARKSILGIDMLSIFFLFCSGDDYLDFGSERLVIALTRFDTVNRAKILNNMVKKLNKEQRMVLQDTFTYFMDKYVKAQKRHNESFWDVVLPEVKEIFMDEFTSI